MSSENKAITNYLKILNAHIQLSLNSISVLGFLDNGLGVMQNIFGGTMM